jgi:hypothetical protein
MLISVILTTVALLTSCDSADVESAERLVVEAYISTGQDLPSVRVSRTVGLDASLGEATDAGVSDANVVLEIEGMSIAYAPVTREAGRYEPVGVDEMVVPPGTSFELSVSWRELFASAGGVTPSPLHIDSVHVMVPPSPVAAALLDSLQFDSLEVNATRGYVYPVEATVWWSAPEDDEMSGEYWVQAQLRPYVDFSSLVLDLFLLPEQVFKEVEADAEDPGVRRWRGLYAVLVDRPDAVLPSHSVRVAVLRSGLDYARYASSRDEPSRREPVSNVQGGLGVVAGIALDSVRVSVAADGSTVFIP